MDAPRELPLDGHWRMAVWALRVGFVGLAVVIAGLVVLSLGSTPWVLAAGLFVWLACVGVTLTGFLLARRKLPQLRPGLWSMRFKLIHDAIGLSVRTGAPR